MLAEYRLKQTELGLEKAKLKRLKTKPARTIDGELVELHANIELPEDLEQALENGATGIGLFRSEFLFLHREGLPTEEEQFEAYRAVAAGMGGLPVTIRTFDLGADKDKEGLGGLVRVAPNPALGLRAIRFCRAEPKMFLTQLRALLRASQFGKLKILIPMLASSHEIDQTLVLLDKAKAQLRERKIKFDEAVEDGVQASEDGGMKDLGQRTTAPIVVRKRKTLKEHIVEVMQEVRQPMPAGEIQKRLVDRGVVALGFGTAVHRSGIPADLAAACARAGLILFEVPYGTPFIAVARAHSEAIAAPAYARRTWALETQSLSIFGARGAGEDTIFHELAHQWFGNSVSVAKWEDLWIAEGAATFFETWWQHRKDRAAFDQAMLDIYDYVVAQNLGPAVVDRPEDLFSDRTYYRGGAALYALQLQIGDSSFFNIMKHFAQDNRGRNVTSEDFIATAVRFSGDGSVRTLLESWLYDDAVPALPGKAKRTARTGPVPRPDIVGGRCGRGSHRGAPAACG